MWGKGTSEYLLWLEHCIRVFYVYLIWSHSGKNYPGLREYDPKNPNKTKQEQQKEKTDCVIMLACYPSNSPKGHLTLLGKITWVIIQ